MITYTHGNLLEAKADALVNTVNTVGVMGKGIALMFKEAFPENFKSYAKACEADEIKTGRLFVTERQSLLGPKWIINFPTKKHWRNPTKLEWVVDGLQELKRFIVDHNIRSIAIPPLGCGNGGLDWNVVKPEIEKALGDLDNVEITVFEPTRQYQNVAKRSGVEKLTPSRALVAELIRRYWILGIDCSILEVQKLAWFLDRSLQKRNAQNPLDLQFIAHRYGPYSNRLQHLLDALDGSYLHCEKRIADATPMDVIWFEDAKKDKVQLYLTTDEAKSYRAALDETSEIIDGFQSPLGMELLASVDWLLHEGKVQPTVEAIKHGLLNWPAGEDSGARKDHLFNERLVEMALRRLEPYQAPLAA